MNQPAYKPRVTRLQPPSKPRWKLIACVSISFVMIALVITDAVMDGPMRQFYTRAPIHEQFTLPNGETLAIHAVLLGSNHSSSFRGKEFTGDDGQVTLVMSCKDLRTGSLSDWSWLKHIEAEDKYGAIVEVTVFEIIQKSQSDTNTRMGKLEKQDFLNGEEVYCVFKIPNLETLKPCEYSVIDTNDEVVATIHPNIPPLQPIEGFYEHSHNLIAEIGPWKVEIVEMNASWSPAHDSVNSQFHLSPSKIYFDYNGTQLDQENLVIMGERLSDGLGNTAGIHPQVNNQPLWKYSSKVARSDYMTNRQDTDLKPLARIDDAKNGIELSKLEGFSQARSLTFMPIGEHERTGTDVSAAKHGSLQLSTRQTRRWKLMHSIFTVGGHSADGGYKYEHSLNYRGTRGDEILGLKIVSKTNQPSTLSLHTKRSLVMLQLEETSNDYLINLFAFDQFNRALQVDAAPDYIDKLPMFLIDTDSDTEYLDLYYSIEPIVPVEIYMKPPTKGLFFPETGTTWYSLAGNREGWQLKYTTKD